MAPGETRVPAGRETHPALARRGRPAERGTRGTLQPAGRGLCPPPGPSDGSTHRLPPAASPSPTAPC